ncbi:LysR family transcriptional regulator (plasmid) [Ketogulonicigenium robustum]|uniref:LysR family transcriptional regulator n=1 Tax=Ketogulonicigenium robustum TaxID=92947 RepID=A0A1W6P2V5_9RHOB|nr:LysR family transcriptional regulator [Ketogulonicigenium robustum]ARO15816.1 LysR family transcriptional regulator [Ketogulonicigenium robustum]
MESKWLEDFLVLAAQRHFGRAADIRNVTQSALSRRIKLLENWLGAPLIDRQTQPVTLTAAGAKFLPRAEELMALTTLAREEARPPLASEHDMMTVCMMSTLSITTFPRLVAQLEEKGEHFRFRFVNASTTLPDTLDVLRSGAVDFLLTYAHPNVTALQSLHDLPHITLGSERCIPVSVPDQAGKPRFDLRQTQMPVDYLSYQNNSFFASALPDVISGGRFTLRTVYENALSAALLAAARVGLGVAWIPEALLGDDLTSGRLVRAADPAFDLLVEIRLYQSTPRKSRSKARFWRNVSQLAPQPHSILE